MRMILVSVLALATPAAARPESTATEVERAVSGFYQAYNAHDFSRVSEVTTPQWNHINPLGGRTIGRSAVLAELRQVHSTFLKGVTDTPLSTDLELLSPSVALVTVRSQTSDYTTPDGQRHVNEQNIRTFVVVKRHNKWLITRDHNTFVR